jgi:hypothetical protein
VVAGAELLGVVIGRLLNMNQILLFIIDLLKNNFWEGRARKKATAAACAAVASDDC